MLTPPVCSQHDSSIQRELRRRVRLMHKEAVGLLPRSLKTRSVATLCCVGVLVLLWCLSTAGEAPAVASAHEQLHQTARGNPRPPAGGVFDVVVLGRGVAGLSAALYAARAGLSVLVIGSESAGQLAATDRLENYPGWSHAVSTVGDSDGGAQLLATIRSQAAAHGTNLAPEGALVSRLELAHQPFEVVTTAPVGAGGRVRGRALIVATGSSARRLGTDGEDGLWGRYLHSCALCDGALYAKEVVLVVGGGDAGVDAALYLARLASRVILVHRRAQFRSSNKDAIAALRRRPNVELLMEHTVVRWLTAQDAGGRPKLLGARLHGAVGDRDVECSGAFLMIGSDPNSGLLSGTPVKLDSEGYVVLSGRGSATSVPGVFAAGEVADATYRQAITAAGDGAKAAIDAERWLAGSTAVQHSSAASTASALQAAALPVDASAPPPPAAASKAPVAPEVRAAAAAPQEVPSCDLTTQPCIEKTVAARPVVVFSKDYCPFCRMALQTLATEGVTKPHVIDLTRPPGKQIQQALGQMTGRRTVPNVFVGGKSIGGGDETVALHGQGKLHALLQAAGALA
eukprot:gnl/TRDRNA2_/TRDRNA2_163224_c0_seq2.p1 gnl/TRDRNA2_/TRDRNA2_163224_c0~~gnl/TRDRNA2_/TRDRNA2_163224_c0_seq2.p1  ORF type:complete len:571 (-),score=97.18 gnl/TRDRNA2_/TRDRNA2_163224_c0_seq2:71-1783(-)